MNLRLRGTRLEIKMWYRYPRKTLCLPIKVMLPGYNVVLTELKAISLDPEVQSPGLIW